MGTCFGFAEFRTIEQTNAALANLNGILVGPGGMYRFQIKRPSGYNGINTCIQVPIQVPNLSLVGVNPNPFHIDWSNFKQLLAPQERPSFLSQIPSQQQMATPATKPAINNESKFIMVSNLPAMMSAEQIIEFISSFGPTLSHNTR